MKSNVTGSILFFHFVVGAILGGALDGLFVIVHSLIEYQVKRYRSKKKTFHSKTRTFHSVVDDVLGGALDGLFVLLH